MNPIKSRVVAVCITALCTFAYACALSEETSTGEQAAAQQNGSNQNGSNQNGSNQNGISLLGFLVDGAMKGGSALTNVRVEKGELVAEQGSTTLRGSQLEGTTLQAQLRSGGQIVTASYRIVGVQPEVGYDPTGTGSTFLYTVEQWNSTTSTWDSACPADHDGLRVAIPLAAEWDESGTRSDSSTMFTLACTSGTIAKCYRWGYRPWVTGYGDLTTMHYVCTRLARADWCGTGVSHTVDGTWIDVWDTLPTPGPIQQQVTMSGFEFDSGWSTTGATCLSSARWSVSASVIAEQCPEKLAPDSARTCNNATEAAARGGLMFKEMDIVP
jgi:hypothetical protein